VEQIESGRRPNSRAATLAALSRALGVTIDYLVSGGASSTMLAHQLFFYRDDEAFSAETVPYLNKGIEQSEAILVVSTPKNIGILRDELGADAEQVEFVEQETWYSSPLSSLNAYRAFLNDKVARGAQWARVVGDPVWSGRTEVETRAWDEYESMVNLVFESAPATLLCTYDERTVNPALVSAARLTHPWIVEGGEITENSMYREPGELP
jgi:transcriptional regulator with XRE-family HTH domain